MSASTRPAQVRRTSSSQSSAHSASKAPTRPQLHVISGRGTKASTSAKTRTRVRPLVRMSLAIGFLAASLVGSLMLRTQMVQDSFEISKLQTSIGVLTQDVQDDQTTLDTLDSSLPQKAEKLGMQPQSTSVSLDLSKYIKKHPQNAPAK